MNDEKVATPAGAGYVLVGPVGVGYLRRALTIAEQEHRLAGIRPPAEWVLLRDAITRAAAFASETAKVRSLSEGPESARVRSSGSVDVERVAAILRCSPQWARQLCRRREWSSARRLGSAWVVDEEEVLAWAVAKAARAEAA